MAKGKKSGFFPPIITTAGDKGEVGQDKQDEEKERRIDELAKHRTLAPGHVRDR